MRAATGTIPLAGLLLALAPASARAQHALVTLPGRDPAYEQLQALDRQGCPAGRVSPHRPYVVGAVVQSIERAIRDSACAGMILEELIARFGIDREAALRRADDVPIPPPRDLGEPPLPDTLIAVAPDLAAAVLASGDKPGLRQRVRLGGTVSVAVTGIRRGDFRPLWNDVLPEGAGTSPISATLRARLTWEGGERVVGVVDAFAKSHTRNDPDIRSRALRRTTGVLDFSEAYIAGRAGPFVLSLGRSEEAWLGEGEESLVLSAHGPPIDRVVASVSTRRFEGRALVAVLDNIVLDTLRDALPSGTPPQRFYRTLVGHVLTWRPSDAIELSLGETALLSRGSRTLDLAYVNPLMVYVVTQNDSGRVGEDSRDNLTVFGAARVRRGGTLLTGELLVDDVQIDSKDRNVTPDQLGWWVRLSQAVPLFRPATLLADYRRIDSYTYSRGFYTEVYQHYDRPLGSELGPGADLLRGGADVWVTGKLRLAGGVSTWRHGALRIQQRPSVRASGHAGEPFPSTTPSRPAVQKALLADLSAQFLSVRLPLIFRVDAARVQNINNEPAPARTLLRAQFMGSYAFRYP